VENLTNIALKSLSPQELFLTNGFKVIFSQDLANFVTDWFAQKQMVIYSRDSMQILKRFSNPQKNTFYIKKTTNEAANLFGIRSNVIGYVVEEDDAKAKLFSIFKEIKNHKHKAVLAEIFESSGTLCFVKMFPLVIRALSIGGTLIIDEFDTSINPIVLMNIINIFHNNDINKKQAQLIFNTHNPIFLNSNLFRKDEIKFVERDDISFESVLYSLSDISTLGKSGTRRYEDYIKNYYNNMYGALHDIDLSPIFEEIISNWEE
jgi:hypothetical protein